MKYNKIYKLIVLILFATSVATRAYGYAEAEQSLETTVQPTVSIVKDALSVESADVQADNGVHTGLNTIFNLNTNGTDTDYDFIMTSYITTESGNVSAYTSDGNIIFAHSTVFPTEEAINNAKTGGNNNQNVIVYPTTVEALSPMTSTFTPDNLTYGNCYVIKLNGASEGSVNHKIDTTPVAGSYNVGQDQAGSYKATVQFTAYTK